MFRRFFKRFLAVFALAPPIRPATAELAQPVDQRATLVMMYDAFRQAAPDLDFALDEQDMAVTLTVADGGEFRLTPNNLDPLLRAETTSAGRQAVLDAHIRNILGSIRQRISGAAEQVPLDPATIIPIVRFDYGDPVETEDEPGLLHRPYLPGLVVYWAEDLPQTTASIDLKRVTAAGLDLAALEERAIQNMRLRATCATERELADTGGIISVEMDGYYESAILLLPEFWQARAAGGKRLIAFATNRHFLFYLIDPSPEVLENTKKLAEQLRHSHPYPLSAIPLEWTETGWQVLND